MSGPRPKVSVVIPARHAAETLPRTLASIESQSYPDIEVIVAAADDRTARVASGAGVRVVENPVGTTPVGLNRAVAAATGDLIIRCDAHAVLPPHYVKRAVETMARTDADNVGGMQVPIGTTFWERAIAAAMASRLGAGDARYRIGGGEGPAETVYLGVFRRVTLERLGGYDEDFMRNQDYELNHRILESGGMVWFDPELRVEYRPRGSLRDLSLQYFQYGRAKRQMARKHPGSLRWRQLAAPLVVLVLGAALVLSVVWPWTLLVALVYLAILEIYAAVVIGEPARSVAVAAALAAMHISWGLGFLTAPQAPGRN